MGLGRLGFAGGLGVLVRGSAASLGPIGRCRFVMGLRVQNSWKTGENVIERRRFRGCGVGLGRLGFAGGLGVLVRGSAASLGDFDFGVKLTLGFHLNGDGE